MKTNSTAVLDLVKVSAGYSGRPVLCGISASVAAGESVALIGPNGCGKSTLLRVVAGLVRADAGEICLAGSLLNQCSPDDRIRLGLGYLAQTRNVFAGLTIEENLRLAFESQPESKALNERTGRVLATFPMLRDRIKMRAGLLSGGHRQMLAVAMVLMRRPYVLLLDEPIAGLSPTAAGLLMEGIHALRSEDRFAMVIVEHRLKQVQPAVDRVLVMREGKIVDDARETTRMLDATWLRGHYTISAPQNP